MKIFCSLLCFLVGASALAQNSNEYEATKSIFEMGKVPQDFPSLVGGYSGRCYWKNSAAADNAKVSQMIFAHFKTSLSGDTFYGFNVISGWSSLSYAGTVEGLQKYILEDTQGSAASVDGSSYVAKVETAGSMEDYRTEFRQTAGGDFVTRIAYDDTLTHPVGKKEAYCFWYSKTSPLAAISPLRRSPADKYYLCGEGEIKPAANNMFVVSLTDGKLQAANWLLAENSGRPAACVDVNGITRCDVIPEYRVGTSETFDFSFDAHSLKLLVISGPREPQPRSLGCREITPQEAARCAPFTSPLFPQERFCGGLYKAP